MNDQLQVHILRHGLIDFGRWEPAIAAAYPDAFAEPLLFQCKLRAAIPAEDLTAYLRTAGAFYLHQKDANNQLRLQNPGTDAKRRHKAQLQRLAKSARQLKLQLVELEKPAADLLWMPISDPIIELMSSNALQFEGQLAAHKDGENLAISLLNREHLQQALTAIAMLATDAASALTPQEGGRPDHPGLAQWVENMRVLWTGAMGHAFTVVDGEHGASPAVDFFGDVLKALDPSIERGTLVSVMRKIREGALDVKTPQDSLGVTPTNA